MQVRWLHFDGRSRLSRIWVPHVPSTLKTKAGELSNGKPELHAKSKVKMNDVDVDDRMMSPPKNALNPVFSKRLLTRKAALLRLVLAGLIQQVRHLTVFLP